MSMLTLTFEELEFLTQTCFKDFRRTGFENNLVERVSTPYVTRSNEIKLDEPSPTSKLDCEPSPTSKLTEIEFESDDFFLI